MLEQSFLKKNREISSSSFLYYMVENKMSETGERIIYFGHGKPRKNRKWKTENTK